MTPEDILFKNMNEMALARADAINKFNNESFQIFSHLIKILRWEDSESFNHHLVDLTSMIRRCHKIIHLYKGHISPDEIFYKTKVQEYYKISLAKKEIKRLTPQYKLIETNLRYEDITSEIEKVFKSLSELWSSKKEIPLSFRVTSLLSTDVQAYLYQLNSYEGK